ncbi:MAG: flagellar hook capping FlgD N-terminal domain-containing protein [Anaerolineaceae bacterium]|nr:flagellar hook capping FlgD N-terminal domain-containing protein [Anaerolineaceae bacterium]
MEVKSATAGIQANSAGQTASTTPKAFAGLNNSDFMLMLMAQLRNQNPLDPMQDKDMMGQVAQLNSLQSLQGIQSRMDEMAKSNQFSYAASLIGKTARVDRGDGSVLEGKICEVNLENRQIQVVLGGRAYPIDALLSISQGGGA